jgi:type VI protein secretion system component VasK
VTRAIDILTSRWWISFIGTALLAGLAWFFAPLLPGFEDWPPRVVLIVALLMVWGGGNALLDLRRLRRDAALAKGIAASSTEET